MASMVQILLSAGRPATNLLYRRCAANDFRSVIRQCNRCYSQRSCVLLSTAVASHLPPRLGCLVGGTTLAAAGVFGLFSSVKDREEGPKDDDITLMVKRAKLLIEQDKGAEAEIILHQALKLSQARQIDYATAYVYDMLGELALSQEHWSKAERLFKETLKVLVSSGTDQDDNAVLEISMKIAGIYASQGRTDLAQQGYQWCVKTLEEKIANKSTDEDTVLLLGMCLHHYAAFAALQKQLFHARTLMSKALMICRTVQGNEHPQTGVLLNDLGTLYVEQGLYEEAIGCFQEAKEVAEKSSAEDLPAILCNMGTTLMHKKEFKEAKKTLQEALALAKKNHDGLSKKEVLLCLEDLEKARKAEKLNAAKSDGKQSS
ncbi:tetratricopeptide repeat protein 19, mitochondrial-like [Branchiostoma floridae]|uniref:Tetratricopeptide repeat protein 19, mitochondrial-like n=1 Tax=Branchiostoma floridae TaxID=7739 RepID=A0A9J7LE47_BRAFL|nr:tetratricopeptide repeat protein 19, mitochondrial-like [Branchiostoma floridae]